MYYHRQALKYVVYGKIYPNPEPNPEFDPAYKWLGHYCGFYPQVWLSKGDVYMTGFNSGLLPKKRKCYARRAYASWRRSLRLKKDAILFGFDPIRGFPIDFEFWWWNVVFEVPDQPTFCLQEANRKIAERFQGRVEYVREVHGPEAVAKEPDYAFWEQCKGDFDKYLREYVFVERDQLVVPSLNLKAAKVVVCRNERQKKQLRQMGFIEDRIRIRHRYSSHG